MYIRQPISFAVTEWPLSPGSQRFIFNKSFQTQNTGRLLMFLAQQLKIARQPFVAYVPFTLLNVYCPIADLSYGANDRPSRTLFQRSPLVFTFALTNRQYSHTEWPKYIRSTPYTRIWGPALRYNSIYLTIKVPQEVLDDTHIWNFGIPNLRYLYNVVGMFTKNLVRSGYQGLLTTGSPDWALLNSNIPNLVKNYPFSMWPYCRDIWLDAPNLIVREQITDQLMHWYITQIGNIRPYLADLKLMFGRDKELHKFLDRGIKQVAEYLQTEIPVELPGQAAAYLMAQALEYPDTTEQHIQNFISSIRQQTLQNDQPKLLSANSYTLAQKLLTNSFDWRPNA